MVNFITIPRKSVFKALILSSLLSLGLSAQEKDSTVAFVPKPAAGYTDTNYFNNLNKSNKEKVPPISIPRLTKEQRIETYKRRLEMLDESSEEYLQIKSKIEKIENTY